MTSDPHRDPIDTSRPHPARVYDWLLGGKDNYPVDQQVAEKLPAEARANAARNRAFTHRSASWPAQQGVDQFLDVGTGIPTAPNLHQIVQRITPTARIVYADNDPIVLRHAEALLVSAPEGATEYLHADVRAPEAILEQAREVLDFRRPIALSLIALMHFLRDEEDPYDITRTLVGALSGKLPDAVARYGRSASGAAGGDGEGVPEGCHRPAHADPRGGRAVLRGAGAGGTGTGAGRRVVSGAARARSGAQRLLRGSRAGVPTRARSQGHRAAH